MSCCATTCAGAARSWVAGCRASPIRAGRYAGRGAPAGVAGVPRREARPTDQPQPPVGAERRLAIVRGRLDPAKRVAHAHHAKVNDVVLAAVAGGLRQLLASRGEDVQGLTQRAMVTISLHQEQPAQARATRTAG